METPSLQPEKHESAPEFRDISHEFATMDHNDFLDFTRSLRNEPYGLSVTTDWSEDKGIWLPRFLKAWLEMARSGQPRRAAMRATEKQYLQDVNAFQSGLEWIEVEE